MPHNHRQEMRFSDLLDKETNFTGFKELEFDDRPTDETFGYIVLRKDEDELQDEEKSRFKNAIKHLIDTGTYQSLVEVHVKMSDYRMHGWHEDRLGLNRFLAWHRKYLTEFEKSLGRSDIELTGTKSPLGLPYWRWSKNRRFPSWLTDLLPIFGSGGPGTPVEDRKNGVNVSDRSEELPKIEQINYLLKNYANLVPATEDALNDYERFTYCLEGYVSGLPAHNHVHAWVDGVMNSDWSPADPIFWLHHCEVDRLWAIWQSTHKSSHPPYSSQALQLKPWNDTNYYTVLDTELVGYRYDTLSVE
jgi:tyrosinase